MEGSNSESIRKEIKYEANIKKLKESMITGLTHDKEGDISLGEDLYASTRIGPKRKNQEDAVVLIKDDEIPNFKMMVVADGMGGHENGEVASHILVTELNKWFKNIPAEKKKSYYKDISLIQTELTNKLNEISQMIAKGTKGGGTTLCCAIIGEQNTIMANIGDSRGYIMKDGELIQISYDDSYVQTLLDRKIDGKEKYRKEQYRFHKGMNLITAYVGKKYSEVEPHIRILNNDEYDMLLLFSDGVTDCLSEDDIAVISRASDKKEVAKQLTQKALTTISHYPQDLTIDFTVFNNKIIGGKDNSTTAVYINNHSGNEAQSYADRKSHIIDLYEETTIRFNVGGR